MKQLSIDEINRLQAENDELRKIIVETPIKTVIMGALLGTVAGQLLLRIIYGLMDVLLR
jgi:hypothetical protein